MYELVGHLNDVGSVGSDLLLSGDGDNALLEALAMSGVSLQDLISGDGSTELIGAVAKEAAKAAALKQIAMRNSGAVINRALDRKRRLPLGFVPTDIENGTSAAIPAAPQNLFRPERLVIPSDIAFDAGVRDIKVGNVSQLVQSVEVPGALFSEVAINTGVTFDTAEVGNQVSVDVRNKSANDFEFSAGLVGSIAK